MLSKGLVDLLTLIQTQATVIDEDGMEPIANGLLHELGGNGRVHTTADSTKDVVRLTDQFANAGDFLVHKLVHCPVLRNAADVRGEVLQKLHALGRVVHLGVELNGVDGLGLVSDTGEFGVGRGSNGMETLRELGELVTVGHPDVRLILDAGKQVVDVALVVQSLGSENGMAIFSSGSGSDVVLAQTVGNLLQTVADTEDGDAEFEEGGVNVGGALLVDGVGTTGEDNTLRLPGEIGQFLSAAKLSRD